MKITKLSLYTVEPRWLFLKIDTDEGICGWGEPVVEGHAHTVKAAVEEMSYYLIGKDPLRIEDHWQVKQHRPRHLTEVHRRTHRLLQRPEQHQERRLRRGHVVLRVRQTDRVHLCKRHQVRLQQRGRGRKGRLAEDPQPPPVL